MPGWDICEWGVAGVGQCTEMVIPVSMPKRIHFYQNNPVQIDGVN
jgi:hypothetical protein